MVVVRARRHIMKAIVPALVMGLALGISQTAVADDLKTVTIFAASSLESALEEFAATPPPGIRIRISTAGSGTVAKQIEAGAPADIFISANEKWATYLTQKDLLVAGSQRVLASNTLVLATHKKSKLPNLPIRELLQHKKVRRIAIGETSSVPAGIYGKEAMDKLDLWTTLKPKLLPAESVRSVLSWVERREADLGFVYESDAAGSDRIRVIYKFTPESEPELAPALYVSAIIKGRDNDIVKSVHDALYSPAMQNSLQSKGLLPPPSTLTD